MKRLIRNIACLLLGFVLAVSAGLALADHTVRHSVTSVVHKMTDGKSVCSAVMLAPGYAMTAAHCTVIESPTLEIEGRKYEITEAYVNPDRDLAVLIVPDAPCPCATMKAWPMTEGENIIVVGFPHGIAKTVTYGQVQARVTNPKDGREYILTTASGLPGNSGGGVFDTEGYLVGILTLGTESGTFTLYVEVLPWMFTNELD